MVVVVAIDTLLLNMLLNTRRSRQDGGRLLHPLAAWRTSTLTQYVRWTYRDHT